MTALDGVVTVGPDEIRALVPMGDAIDAVRAAFLSLAAGEFEMPTRTALGDGAFLVMPVHHRPSGTATVKTLSLNFDGRDPAIAGTVTWTDLARPGQLVADAATVTALRTGAVTGVATDLLADPGASSCTVIGAGAQAADQIRAVHAVRPLVELTIVSRDPARAARLARLIGPELPGVVLSTSTDPDAAVVGRAVVVCATPSLQPLFSTMSLAPGAHVNAIGSFRPTMHEVPEDLLAQAFVVVDQAAAVLAESGEIIDALASGAITRASLHELGQVLLQGVRHSGRTVFKSVGVAAQDWAIGRILAAKVWGQERSNQPSQQRFSSCSAEVDDASAPHQGEVTPDTLPG